MNRKVGLLLWLSAFFVASLLLGDVTGGKTILTELGDISVGILPFPITFLLTDIVNDFYGHKVARYLTLVGAGMATYACLVLNVAVALPTSPRTYLGAEEFARVFGGSKQLFVASLLAFVIGQFLDIAIFRYWKRRTGDRYLWLRATGSTVVSQLVDTVVINFVFWSWAASADPSSQIGQMSLATRYAWVWRKVALEYGIKLVVALGLTPLLYALHGIVRVRFGLRPAPLHGDVENLEQP